MASAPAYEVEICPTGFDNPVLSFYFAYWHRKLAGRAMPSYADIKPVELKPHLGFIILLEALPDYTDFRYRRVGTDVTEYFLGDATGSTIREVYARAGTPELLVESIVRLHRTVCESKSVIRVKGPPGEWQGHFYPEFDALYLPLSDSEQVANTVLTAFSFDRERLRAARKDAAPG
jgi:hypothetical protein